MSVADTLKRKFGGNLSESLGRRSQPEITEGVVAPTIAGASPDDGRTRAREAGHLEIERIIPDPSQPRKIFDAESLDRLAESLKKHGQLLPIRVRWNQDLGKWIILSGERRFQASQRAGLKTLSCLFVDKPLSDAEILTEQVIENLLREDLRPMEQAEAYQKLMTTQAWNASQLAEALHISKATVSRMLALLKLPEDVQQQVDRGEVPSTAAYELTRLDTDEAKREMAKRIVAEGMSRQDAVEAVREVEEQAKAPAAEFRRETPPKAETLPLHQTEPEPAATKEAKKRGKPRSAPKERSYRVDGGAKVVVSFSKKAPSPEEVIKALEQALSKARTDAKFARAA